MKSVGRYSYLLKSYELDYRKRIPVAVLYRFLQESAENNAVELGFDTETLLRRGLTWVLFKMHMQIDRYVVGRKPLEVETWPSKVDSRLAHREFAVFEPGVPDPFARASSIWMLLNMENGRPILLQPVLDGRHISRTTPGIPSAFPPLPRTGDVFFRKEFPVRLSDIDLNGHVNNIHYVEWLTESVPEEVWRSSSVRELQVEYKRQVRYGSVVSVETSRLGDGQYRHVLTASDRAAEVMVARSVWGLDD